MKPESKLDIYRAICQINHAFTRVTANCRRLQQAGLFGRAQLNNYCARAEELQSEINRRLAEVLQTLEATEWARLGRQVRRTEEIIAQLDTRGRKAGAKEIRGARREYGTRKRKVLLK